MGLNYNISQQCHCNIALSKTIEYFLKMLFYQYFDTIQMYVYRNAQASIQLLETNHQLPVTN